MLSVLVVEPEDIWHETVINREMAKGAPPSVEQGTFPVEAKCSTPSDCPSTIRARSKAAYTVGSVDNQTLDVLLDSGASCSVISKEYISSKDVNPLTPVKVVNADGSDLASLGTLVMNVSIGDIQTDHSFIVVDHLSVPVILSSHKTWYNRRFLSLHIQ